MSDTDAAAAASKQEMPQADMEFLLTCIRNTTAGVLTVDATKIAIALGYQNPRSVTNKISLLKKKYGLAISTAGAKMGTTAQVAEAAASASASIPRTPVPPKTPKGKVTKTKATPKKKTPAKKGPAKSAVKVDDDSEEVDADEEMTDAKETLPEKDDDKEA